MQSITVILKSRKKEKYNQLYIYLQEACNTFKTLKKAFTTALILKNFDVNQEV